MYICVYVYVCTFVYICVYLCTQICVYVYVRYVYKIDAKIEISSFLNKYLSLILILILCYPYSLYVRLKLLFASFLAVQKVFKLRRNLFQFLLQTMSATLINRFFSLISEIDI